MSKIQRLDLNIKTNGSYYTLMRRSEDKALYKQTIEGQVSAYEMFRIKVREEETIKGVTYPKREVFCSNQDFGVTAKSLMASIGDEGAIKRFEQFEKTNEL